MIETESDIAVEWKLDGLGGHGLKWCTFVIIAVVVLTSFGTSLCAGERENTATLLVIEWQRFVDEDGKTCDRCGGTEKELRRSVETLKRSLRPLGIRTTLVKRSLGPECAKNIVESNRILIAGRPLEDWLGAKVGTSVCGSCCAKLGETMECRTTSLDGKTYEVIPAQLIVKAGLKAASEIIAAPSPPPCCPPSKSSTRKNGKCCS